MIVGVVMLEFGWMNRYLPAVAIEMALDLAYAVDDTGAGPMSAWAVVKHLGNDNYQLLWCGPAFMSARALVTRVPGLSLIQYGTMRFDVARRRRAQTRARRNGSWHSPPSALPALSPPCGARVPGLHMA